MPTYQYRCTECGHDLEAVQKFSDAPLTECPACGGKLRKVYNAVGVVFKGSGFYKTDSRSSNGSKGKHHHSHSSEKSGDNGSGEKSGGSSEKSSEKQGSETGSSGSKNGSDSKNGSGSSSSTPAGSGASSPSKS